MGSTKDRTKKYHPLPQYVAMWPTPRSANPGSRINSIGGKVLSQEVEIAEGVRNQDGTLKQWPTPNKWDGQRGPDARDRPGSGGPNLAYAAKTFPTPCASTVDMGTMEMGRYSGTERKTGSERAQYKPEVGGMLNPPWVEWLMGWPLGWTDLKPLEMDKFQWWSRQFGSY